MDVDKKLYLIAFYYQKISIVESNYEIHDKVLLAIVDSFQECHYFLKGATHPMTIYIDHKNLKYFMSAQVLNPRQAWWNILLSRFDFVIAFQLEKQQGLFDALSRRLCLAQMVGAATFDQQCTTLLKLE